MDAEPLREIHRKVLTALREAEHRDAESEVEALTTAVNIANAMFAADYDSEDPDIVDTPLIESFLGAVVDAKKRFPHLDV